MIEAGYSLLTGRIHRWNNWQRNKLATTIDLEVCMKVYTDPKYPQYEIRLCNVGGFARSLRRYRVHYKGWLAVSDWMTLRGARRAMVRHAAQHAVEKISG